MKIPLGKIAKIGVTIVLVALLVYLTDWHGVAQHVRDMNPWWIVVYGAIVTAGNILSAYRWRLLALVAGSTARLRSFLGWYLTGTFLNNFFPGFIGGDAYRVYRSRNSYPEQAGATATITVILDRVIGLYGALCVTALLTIALIAGVGESAIATDTLLVAIGMSAVVCAIIATMAIVVRDPVIRRLTTLLPTRYQRFIAPLLQYTGVQIARNALWSGIFALVGVAASNYVLFLAFGVALPIIPFALLVIFASMVASLPVSIGNFGVKEWAYVMLLDGVGVGASLAVTVVLVSRVAQALLSLAGAAAYYMEDGGTNVAGGEARRFRDALSIWHVVLAAVGVLLVVMAGLLLM